ncbi:MAG: rhodanese-like domain-containing protein [Bacteroidetes bacterium]|nr:rhodanese-like domain-containing protein [Bacteroidota bacterium]
MNRYLVILLIVTTVFSYSCMDKAESEIQVVTAEEMQEFSEINDVKLVDVSIAESQNEALLKNTQNIDYLSPNFDKEINKLDKSKPVIVYCKSGNDSVKCIEKMEDAGFVKIYDVDKSIAKWKFIGSDIRSNP